MKKTGLIILLCTVAALLGAFLIKYPGPKAHFSKHSAEAGQPQSQRASNSIPPSGSTRTLPQQAITMTNLPEHIQLLVLNFLYEPTWLNSKKLTAADKDILMQLYRQEPSLVKKRGIIIALSFIGDEEVVEMFKHTLSDQYAGRKLKPDNEGIGMDEDYMMSIIVGSLGFLANKSDSAFYLVKNGIEPKFWKEYCKFTPSGGADFYGLMAGRSIEAIGRSQRPDVMNFLESLKPLPLVNYLDTSIMRDSFEGSVVDAAFANDIISQRGLEFYKNLYLNLDNSLQVMTEWEKQGNGLAWHQWYLKKKME